MKFRLLSLLLCILIQPAYLSAQMALEDAPPKDWFHLDEKQDGFRGISTKQAYQLLKKRKSTPVTVAIIDSGVDIEHEDLKSKIWINTDEIAGNGQDDDQNGYVDDVHGWDFIGGADGEDINQETFELTRIYRNLKEKYEGKNPTELKKEEREEYAYYQKIEKDYQEKIEEIKTIADQYEEFQQTIYIIEQVTQTIQEHLDKESFTLEEVQAIETDEERLSVSKKIMEDLLSRGASLEEVQEQIAGDEAYFKYYLDQLKYGYNLDFDPRTVVGDKVDDLEEKYYGNNEVTGPDAEHGTHVAGIVGADRDNKLGIQGVANNVQLMIIRAVPDGDERDKDVANAIRYAVDNGARVVNMSFGKDYSPHKSVVDEAVQYAEKKGVLLIHAAGNDGANIDEADNFPSKDYLNGKRASNWIEVGASSWGGQDNFVGDFSNYGQDQVDIFAPGVSMYSTVPEQQYEDLQGTSMAAPVVTGVAALLMSYFPDLDATEIKEIILKSALRYDQSVNKPGTRSEEVAFAKLSQTGGIVNAYEAVKMALKKSK